MRYFIYPSGVNGRGLADTISLLEPKSECVLIDDAATQNLDFLAQNIQPDDLVLVASHNYFEQCTKKLYAREITHYINGIEWIGEKLNAKIRNLRDKNKKAIGLAYGSDSSVCEESFCNIDEDLKAKGYEVFYFFCTKESYQKYYSQYTSHCILTPHKV
ncbi:MAG: hypothetical protein J1E31_04865, partial [Helicobacter sp.]|nr:hypothetical protein [Helicobacter sp.]